MKCSVCGFGLATTQTACPFCGTGADGSPAPNPPAPAGRASGRRSVFVAFLLLGLLGGLGVFLWGIFQVGTWFQNYLHEQPLLGQPWRQWKGPLPGYSFSLPANYAADPGIDWVSRHHNLANVLYTPYGESQSKATRYEKTSMDFIPTGNASRGTAFAVFETNAPKGGTFSRSQVAQIAQAAYSRQNKWEPDTKDKVPSPYREAVYGSSLPSGLHQATMFVLVHHSHCLALVVETVAPPNAFRDVAARIVASIRM